MSPTHIKAAVLALIGKSVDFDLNTVKGNGNFVDDFGAMEQICMEAFGMKTPDSSKCSLQDQVF